MKKYIEKKHEIHLDWRMIEVSRNKKFKNSVTIK